MNKAMKNIVSALAVIILALFLCASLFGCSTTSVSEHYAGYTPLIAIQSENCLYYYENTGIVYIVFSDSNMEHGYGYMAPFYSENGKLCRYDVSTGSIVEIDN